MRELREDTRGAVMLTGLFFAFFLVGALWFVIGIGDAIVFRERMQEAADHAAFTSAALHAKGMNFIAAVNIIMLALIVMHLVLGLIHDLTLATCILSGAACGAWFEARSVYTKYSNDLMKPTLRGLHQLERAAAYGYPWLGMVKSVKVGDTYGKQHRVGDIDVVAVSPSMVPDFAMKGATKVGLPVSAKPMKELCVKTADWVFEQILGYDPNKKKGRWERFVDFVAKGVAFAKGGFLGSSDVDPEKVVEQFKKIFKGAVVDRYCNDVASDDSMKNYVDGLGRANKSIDKKNKDDEKKFHEGDTQGPFLGMPLLDLSKSALTKLDPGFDSFWGQEGPLVVDGSAKNGHFLMQVWAINFRPRLEDASESKVKIASRDYSGGTPKEGPLGYFAQAEFYFDCDAKWGDAACNGEAPEHHAMFALKWRARLRHVEIPQFGELVGGWLYTLVTDSDAYGALRKIITDDNAIYDRLSNGPFSTAAVDELKKKIDEQVAKGEAAARSNLVNGLQEAHDEVLDGNYH